MFKPHTVKTFGMEPGALKNKLSENVWSVSAKTLQIWLKIFTIS